MDGLRSYWVGITTVRMPSVDVLILRSPTESVEVFGSASYADSGRNRQARSAVGFLASIVALTTYSLMSRSSSHSLMNSALSSFGAT